jgi:hypothetical protein
MTLREPGDFNLIQRVIGEFHKSRGDGSLIEAATVVLPPV